MFLKLGSKGSEVKKLQQDLSYLGYDVGTIDGIFGPRTEDAVEKFQTHKKTYADGIVGPFTFRLLAESLGETYVSKEDKESPKDASEKLTWVKCPADKIDDIPGYGVVTLRSDAAEQFKKLYAEVKELGGVITSSGGRRRLSQKSAASRSKKSMHYTGRAFDLALYSGMQDPEDDPFIMTFDPSNPRKFVVWCRTDSPQVPQVSLRGVYVKTIRTQKGKRRTELRSKPVVVRAFNFTELAKKYGFERISGRRSFFSGGKYAGAEWWHFQWETGLVKGETSFGEDLLRIYSLKQCEDFQYWREVKNTKFGEGWA